MLFLAPLDGAPQLLGALAMEDKVRPEVREAIAPLRELRIRKIAMIAGDARPVADAVAADLGFRPGTDEVFAEILPADKDEILTDLQAPGLTVAMVRNSVNDAPALARTDVAIESAGVVLPPATRVASAPRPACPRRPVAR